MKSPRLAVGLYVGGVGTLSVALVALWIVQRWEANGSAIAFFWLLYVLGDRLHLERPVQGIPLAGLRSIPPTLSAGFLVLLVCAFAVEPLSAALVGLGSLLAPGGWRGWLRALFNAAQLSISAGVASAVFHLTQMSDLPETVGLVVGAFGGALIGVALNTALVGGVLSIERRRKFRGVVRELAWPSPGTLAFALLALIVALLYRDLGAASAILILAPLFVLRRQRSGKVELDASHERTIRAFVRAVELKDEYTSRHSERVAEIAVQLHRHLGCPSEELVDRYYGALLHDIGKIAVSGRVLTKPGQLTDEEFEVVKRHPSTGAMVVARIEFLRHLVPEILHHHERLDGKGYPNGLERESIPAAARILAVADVFEALTSERPYRNALSNREAIDELQQVKGTQLDPNGVRALIDLLESGHVFPVLPARERPERKEVPTDVVERRA